MNSSKKEIIAISKKVQQQQKLTPLEVASLLTFSHVAKNSKVTTLLKQLAVPLSLLFGFLFTAFPTYFEHLANTLPSWTNFSPQILTGVDYLWDLIGEPVRKANIMYHIPNIVLYSFGIFGIKKLFDALDKRTWLDKVYAAQTSLQTLVENGNPKLLLERHHSVLFVGKGDFIGMQFVLNHRPGEAVTIAEAKPKYTDIWNFYNADINYEDLKDVIDRTCTKDTGEYFFFPVKDDQIFLPNSTAYDLSPHKLDILCQNIRTVEKEKKWKPKRIIIVGDRYHKSFVRSEDKKRVVKRSEDTISLESIAKKYPNVTLIDPTEIVLNKIIEIAHGRKVVFRATKEGIAEYKERFYMRLEKLGHNHNPRKKGVLTIGYDLFEDQTEQQTLARVIDDYYPIVLSKNVFDALIRNGYKKDEFLYVPNLVLQTVSTIAAEQ